MSDNGYIVLLEKVDSLTDKMRLLNERLAQASMDIMRIEQRIDALEVEICR